jgi:hypothetical protein
MADEVCKRDDWLTLEVEGFGTVAVPVATIARNRAEHYKHEFGGDVERSLEEDTWPLFESETFECEDWARNNMNWSDVVQDHILLVREVPPGPDFQDAWLDKEYNFLSAEEVAKRRGPTT